MKRRKKRAHPFDEIAEAVIALAIEPGISEEFIEGGDGIFESELELRVVGAGSTIGVESDDMEELTVTDDGEFWMKPSKDGLRLLPSMEKVLADMSCFKTSGINSSKFSSSFSDSSNSKLKSTLGVSKVKESSCSSAQGRSVRNKRKVKHSA